MTWPEVQANHLGKHSLGDGGSSEILLDEEDDQSRQWDYQKEEHGC